MLVNNAGLGGDSKAVEETTDESLREHMEANFLGCVHMMQLVLPTMRARETGAIVNVTSAHGRFTTGCHSVYCASKYALEAISEQIAQEVVRFGTTFSGQDSTMCHPSPSFLAMFWAPFMTSVSTGVGIKTIILEPGVIITPIFGKGDLPPDPATLSEEELEVSNAYAPTLTVARSQAIMKIYDRTFFSEIDCS